MNPELCSSCPTPWKKVFKDDWEAEEALERIASEYEPGDPARYPKTWYVCPYMPHDVSGGLIFHYHLTSLTSEESY